MSLTLRQYQKPGADGRPVLAVVQADYHLGEILPLRNALMDQGVNLVIAMPEPKSDILSPFRAGSRRAKQTDATLAAEGFSPIDAMSTRISDFAGLVVLTDWGVTRDLVLEAKAKMVPSFGIVEGVQDFADDDTGRERLAYRTVDIALCKGRDDFEALTGASREIVGSNRLEQLLRGPLATGRWRATVNCNFSYGVLSSSRRSWLQSVDEGCERASVKYQISKHPGDHGWTNPLKVNSTPIADLIQCNGILISRFSTVILDALAIGTQVIYHNPHGEKAPTFHNSMDGFTITTSSKDLTASLQPDGKSPSQRRDDAQEFLMHNVDVCEGTSPAVRAAQIIHAAIA